MDAGARRRLRPEFARAAPPAIRYSHACRGPSGPLNRTGLTLAVPHTPPRWRRGIPSHRRSRHGHEAAARVRGCSWVRRRPRHRRGQRSVRGAWTACVRDPARHPTTNQRGCARRRRGSPRDPPFAAHTPAAPAFIWVPEPWLVKLAPGCQSLAGRQSLAPAPDPSAPCVSRPPHTSHTP